MSKLEQFTYSSIATGNNNVLHKCMNAMKIMTLPVDTGDMLLVKLLSWCMEFDNSEAVHIIIKYYTLEDIYEEDIEVFPSLFLKPMFNIELLTWLAKVHDTFCHREIITDIIKSKEVVMISRAIKILDIIYGEKDYNFYASLKEMSMLQNNDIAGNALERRMREFPVYANKPSWMVETEKENYELIDEADEIEENVKSSLDEELTEDKIKDLIVGGMEFLRNYEDPEKVLEKFFSLDKQKQNELIEPLVVRRAMENLQSDKELFKIFGPAHPFTNDPLDGSNECQKYGGHRMFLCNCNEHYDPDTDTFEEDVDWFNDGTCDYCTKKIRNRYCSVRRPNVSGGWIGAYCCMLCLRKDLSKNTLNNQPDKLTTGLVKEMEDMMNENGIYDRE
jgi:hypothetical protein